jgi:hypothetical protein
MQDATNHKDNRAKHRDVFLEVLRKCGAQGGVASHPGVFSEVDAWGNSPHSKLICLLLPHAINCKHMLRRMQTKEEAFLDA